jgi:uncharacterized phage infection (PIP) family protein YhgE
MSQLKAFETTLTGISDKADKLRMLDDCKNVRSPFNATHYCYELSGNIVNINRNTTYSAYTGYTPYSNINVSSPHVTLTDISYSGSNHRRYISYNNILGSLASNAYISSVDKITALYQDIEDLSGGLNRSADFNSNIKDKHKTINELRSDLDNRMREIYNPEDEDPFILHNQSIYMTLSWTILATSVLYYLFVKL